MKKKVDKKDALSYFIVNHLFLLPLTLFCTFILYKNASVTGINYVGGTNVNYEVNILFTIIVSVIYVACYFFIYNYSIRDYSRLIRKSNTRDKVIAILWVILYANVNFVIYYASMQFLLSGVLSGGFLFDDIKNIIIFEIPLVITSIILPILLLIVDEKK